MAHYKIIMNLFVVFTILYITCLEEGQAEILDYNWPEDFQKHSRYPFTLHKRFQDNYDTELIDGQDLVYRNRLDNSDFGKQIIHTAADGQYQDDIDNKIKNKKWFLNKKVAHLNYVQKESGNKVLRTGIPARVVFWPSNQ